MAVWFTPEAILIRSFPAVSLPPRSTPRKSVARWRAFAAIACGAALASELAAQAISPHLVGNNLWLANRNNASTTPSTTVMSLAGQAGIRFIRIGGNEFDSNMPSNDALLTWINRIRAIGAEPLVQVSQYRSAAQAAATVEFLNITSGANITYWSIGNEPWLRARNVMDPDPTESEIAASIEAYFKPIAIAMKAVDPAIKIFGVDSEDFQSGLHARLFGGSNNIAGKIPGQDYYYCDGLSWHRYPQADGIDPAWQGLADFRTRIQNCRALIDSVNASEGRTGGDALLWAIGEFNSKNGTAVHTWGNGQMFAGIYGLSMKHEATFASSWSLHESNGARTGSDFSLFDGTGLSPRPSYWHTQFTSRHFTGNYLEGNPSVSSNTSELLVYGAEDPSLGQISVMIMNRGYQAVPYTLHLNLNGNFSSPGATVINVDGKHPATRDGTLAPRSTKVLVFRRDSVTEIFYSNEHFTNNEAPVTTVTPSSPLGGLLDGFDYPGVDRQGYWDSLHVGDGLASVADSRLTLRASNTAYASATLGSPVLPMYNFFKRGFAILLDGFSQTSEGLQSQETQFRLCINSTSNRSFGSEDSLVLRVSPGNIRLGYKIDQTGVHGEMRSGIATTNGSLLDLNISGAVQSIRLSLEPGAGESMIFFQLQLDGDFGRIVRRGSFTAAITDWGTDGDSALVLESRRDSAGIGGFAEASIANIHVQPLQLDNFFGYASYAEQRYWQPLSVGASSLVQITTGSALLTARASSFASSAIAGNLIPELNFFHSPFTLDIGELNLTHENLPPEEAYFRISLCSTPQRSFTSPDAFTVRLTPDNLTIGYKLDQPGTDSELRADTIHLPLADIPLPGPAVRTRLTLIPLSLAGPATRIYYGVQVTTNEGEVTRTGSFTADATRWGLTGDSSLVLEARRASATNTDNSSFMRAEIGSVGFSPIPEDFFGISPIFEIWRLGEFSKAELDSPMMSGPSGTPAGDGVANLLKYAFGLKAKTPAFPLLLPALASTHSLIHGEREGVGDISYHPEASTDLVTWDVPVIGQSRSPGANGWVDVSSRANPTGDAPKLFYRLRVASPPEP